MNDFLTKLKELVVKPIFYIPAGAIILGIVFFTIQRMRKKKAIARRLRLARLAKKRKAREQETAAQAMTPNQIKMAKVRAARNKKAA
jgi:hypothetical protein